MAQKTEFAYHNIELYKSESLGSGSYGGVCKAKCDGLLCAAKIMHPSLFDLRDTGADSYLRKFQEECHLLSLARHPNVVQYLATYYDPDTKLPILLMELCDESLTAFLERSPDSLPYYTQLNICHDIALALVYLHSNGVIHRDLTGNNVLIIAGPRAKITDFGMSKLATVNPRMTALTLCPGNALYMSPEALNASKSYSAKLDIFSFGVIVIQVLTRLFPDPTDRFREVHVPQFKGEVREVVPEIERREAHLKLIPDTHSLKLLVIQCLKKEERQRPSAEELSKRLSDLKQSSQYMESIRQAQSSSSIQQLQQQLRGQRILTEAKTRQVREREVQITELQNSLEEKDRQLHQNQCTSETDARQLQQKVRELQENQHTIASMECEAEIKERELQQKQEQLQASEQLVSEFQQSLQQKEKTISELQQTISAHERKICQLERCGTASGDLPEQQPVTTPHTTVAVVQKDISIMTWKNGKCAPQNMARGAAVVHGNTAYFRPGESHKVFSYQKIQGEEQWSQLPDIAYRSCGLAVIDGLLTGVGGYSTTSMSALFSLTGEGDRQQWSQVFPPMPTPRQSAVCVTTEQALVVAGGFAGDAMDTVELMSINTKQWTSLPHKSALLSGTLCRDTLYLAGGYDKPWKSVFSCSISDLTTAPHTLAGRIRKTFGSRASINVMWKEISSLPVIYSTLASFNGDLLAVGGCGGSENSTTVYRYYPDTNLWRVVSHMRKKRSWCFAVTLHKDCLIVVGGFAKMLHGDVTNTVEILE